MERGLAGERVRRQLLDSAADAAALGAVTATAGPAIASLTGDYFPARERGRVYAYILGGEIIGSAVGFIVVGTVASAICWRAAFVLLAIPGFFLARELWRTVPEPLRGGQSRLEPGARALRRHTPRPAPRPNGRGSSRGRPRNPKPRASSPARPHSSEASSPIRSLVLNEDPQAMGLVASIRYIMSIPTNVLMIISSALGYFFFAGLQTFAVLFVRGHYHTSQVKAELVLGLLVVGAIIGTLISGRLTDAHAASRRAERARLGPGPLLPGRDRVPDPRDPRHPS